MLTKEEFDELELKYKRVARIADRNGNWEVVMRKPSHAEYKRFRAMLHNEAQKPDAAENLARVCVVYPSRAEFDALLEDYPAIGDACGNALGELAGFTVDQSAK